jgi:hypothetical protein
MEIEIPEMLKTLKKGLNGLFESGTIEPPGEPDRSVHQ